MQVKIRLPKDVKKVTLQLLHLVLLDFLPACSWLRLGGCSAASSSGKTEVKDCHHVLKCTVMLHLSFKHG